VADREARLPAFRALIEPLRAALRAQPFLAGDAPAYADHIVFGSFQWARCTSAFPLLETDDPVALWRGRMLDLHAGLARRAPGFPC
jgi:glutathione S-transferase